jgi:hypothetical protein
MENALIRCQTHHRNFVRLLTTPNDTDKHPCIFNSTHPNCRQSAHARAEPTTERAGKPNTNPCLIPNHAEANSLQGHIHGIRGRCMSEHICAKLTQLFFGIDVADVSHQLSKQSAVGHKLFRFIQTNQDRSDCKPLPTQSTQSNRRLGRYTRQNSDCSRISGHARSHLQGKSSK